MNVLERIKSVIKPMSPSPKNPTTVTAIQEEAAQVPTEKKEFQIPVSVGEYFPWKGCVFQIIEVGNLEFKAVCKGLTKNRAEKLGSRS